MMHTRGVLLALGLVVCTVNACAQSAGELFKGADLELGARLIQENRCAECHSRRMGGDGSAIFRPQGRINTPGLLRGMIEQCNMELNLRP